MPTELSVKTTLAGDRTPQHSARDGGSRQRLSESQYGLHIFII